MPAIKMIRRRYSFIDSRGLVPALSTVAQAQNLRFAHQNVRVEQAQHLVEFFTSRPAPETKTHGTEADGFGHTHRPEHGRQFVLAAVTGRAGRGRNAFQGFKHGAAYAFLDCAAGS